MNAEGEETILGPRARRIAYDALAVTIGELRDLPVRGGGGEGCEIRARSGCQGGGRHHAVLV